MNLRIYRSQTAQRVALFILLAFGLTVWWGFWPWEKSNERVAAAVKDLEIKYPVVQDNDRRIWNRFAIWAWPTAVLVDKRGIARYHHVGEGAYGETEAVIRRLLAESG